MQVDGNEVIGRARRRAGVTVAELANRMNVPAGTIEAWESGQEEPTFRAVTDLVTACGLNLANVLIEPDPDLHDLSLLETSLALNVDQRLRRVTNYVNFVRAGQRAMREAS